MSATELPAPARRAKVTALPPRRLVILGATGSIGGSTAEVIAGAPGLFEVEAVVLTHPEVVECAAVARVASRQGSPPAGKPPQFTTTRSRPTDISIASVPAWA